MKIVCIKATPTLTLGKIYEDIFEGKHLVYRVENDRGNLFTYPAMQFRTVSEFRESKINEILNVK